MSFTTVGAELSFTPVPGASGYQLEFLNIEDTWVIWGDAPTPLVTEDKISYIFTNDPTKGPLTLRACTLSTTTSGEVRDCNKHISATFYPIVLAPKGLGVSQ